MSTSSNRSIGYLCNHCGALTLNYSTICDDCAARLEDPSSPLESLCTWAVGIVLAVGLTFFFFALYWSMWHD